MKKKKSFFIGLFIIIIVAASALAIKLSNKTLSFDKEAAPVQYSESEIDKIITEGQNKADGIKCDCNDLSKNTGNRNKNDPMALFFHLECQNTCNSSAK